MSQVDRLISREDVSPQAIASAQWWLERHPEDVIAATDDGDDILIITPEQGRVVWINPDGEIKVMKGGWEPVDTKPWTVKMEVTLKIDKPTDGTPANRTNPMLIDVSKRIEECIRSAYSPDGEELMGYPGPYVQQVTVTYWEEGGDFNPEEEES